jgi:purine-cytosine permease-like protein
MKWLIYLVFIVLYIIVTFFGIGPVLFADGSDQERWTTFIIVLAIYVLITFIFRLVLRSYNKRQ